MSPPNEKPAGGNRRAGGATGIGRQRGDGDYTAKPKVRVAVTDENGKPRRQADILTDIGRAHDLFRGSDGEAYARVDRSLYAVGSSAYREMLAGEYFRLTKAGCNRNALTDATTTLAAMARFNGDTREVWLRVARADDGLVLDLGDDTCRAIHVTADGWTWASHPPMFRRSAGMKPLPEPDGPDFNRLWRHLNVSVEHRPLIAGWLLAAFRPGFPCPIVLLSGQQGAGKSSASRMLRALVDPSSCPLRAPPSDIRDLLVGARNSWLVGLDNLSGINAQFSDALCRLATGGAISERQLYTNVEEVLVELQRPVIANGIDDIATRPDLAERGLHVELDVIANRRTEADLWRRFNADAPAIFGGLLQGLSAAVRDHHRTTIANPPRMADFATWAIAGLPAMGIDPDEFLVAYRRNLTIGLSAGIEASPAGMAVIGLMTTRTEWTGTASDLLAELAKIVDEATLRSHAWPRSPRGLSGVLRRLAPSLRLHGIKVEQQDRTAAARHIRLCKVAVQPSQPSQPSSYDANDDHDERNPTLHAEVESFDL